MAAKNSPQPLVVGELIQNNTTTIPNQKENIIIQNNQLSYAASLFQTNTSAFWNQTNLKQVEVIHGVPTFQFTREERLDYAKEEGLHQAIVVKLSSNLLELSTLRNLLPKILGIKGQALIGQLAPRQILIRMDQFDDFGTSLERSVLYFNHNGRQHQIRVFPWSIDFSVMEETTKAAVWISMPNLPPELFAKKALLSIASTVGLPISIDKPTLLKSRPSTARVKVILDLKDKLPEKVVLQLIDEQTGKINDWHQVFVYDNIPLYCYHCKHLGHDENSCRNLNGKKVTNAQEEEKSVKQGEEPAVKEVKDQLDNQKNVKESNYVAMGITAGDVSVGPKEDNGVTINNCDTNYFVQTAESKEKEGSLIQNEIGVQISNEKGTALESDIAKHDEREGHLCHLAKQRKDSNIESGVGQLGLENNQKVAHGKTFALALNVGSNNDNMGKSTKVLAGQKVNTMRQIMREELELKKGQGVQLSGAKAGAEKEIERVHVGSTIKGRHPMSTNNKLNDGLQHMVGKAAGHDENTLGNNAFNCESKRSLDTIKTGEILQGRTIATTIEHTIKSPLLPDDEGDNWITVRKSSRKKQKQVNGNLKAISTMPLCGAPGHASGGMQARRGIWTTITFKDRDDEGVQMHQEIVAESTTTVHLTPLVAQSQSSGQQLQNDPNSGDSKTKTRPRFVPSTPAISSDDRKLLDALF